MAQHAPVLSYTWPPAEAAASAGIVCFLDYMPLFSLLQCSGTAAEAPACVDAGKPYMPRLCLQA